MDLNNAWNKLKRVVIESQLKNKIKICTAINKRPIRVCRQFAADARGRTEQYKYTNGSAIRLSETR